MWENWFEFYCFLTECFSLFDLSLMWVLSVFGKTWKMNRNKKTQLVFLMVYFDLQANKQKFRDPELKFGFFLFPLDFLVKKREIYRMETAEMEQNYAKAVTMYVWLSFEALETIQWENQDPIFFVLIYFF